MEARATCALYDRGRHCCKFDGSCFRRNAAHYLAYRHPQEMQKAYCPNLLRTGKCLGATRRTITLGFREPPLAMFAGETGGAPNELVLELTDSPRISLDIRTKTPGPDLALEPHTLSVRFGGEDSLEAYEKLLLDAMAGDHTLFTSTREVERLWELCDPVLADPPTAQQSCS